MFWQLLEKFSKHHEIFKEAKSCKEVKIDDEIWIHRPLTFFLPANAKIEDEIEKRFHNHNPEKVSIVEVKIYANGEDRICTVNCYIEKEYYLKGGD